jgi:hypothetical protein
MAHLDCCWYSYAHKEQTRKRQSTTEGTDASPACMVARTSSEHVNNKMDYTMS